MGVGGNFWDLLKPYARSEGFDYLRGKRVAVDLSYWIVQHETAIKGRVRNPHLRLTFFRTINLFSKFGAFPVFVTDGTPSPLKSQARIAKFFHGSGIDLSSLVVLPDKNASVERNGTFLNCVKECVELLELFGMPVLKAKGEAEALCAQLNSEGHVDACITADSDAFLFGAKSVIKCIRPNSKEPIECYNMSDIEAGLGLKRNHLIAMSLLVGNDHDLNGVQGVGLETALRFVQNFSENDILTRLCQIGKGETLLFQGCVKSDDDIIIPCLDESSPKKKKKSSHCSLCGHPGSKRAHLKFSCEYCGSTGAGCMEKPEGFRCDCSFCDMDQKEKEQKKHENWQIRICNKIATEQNFPNSEIIDMYMCNDHGYFSENDSPVLSWESPKTEMLVDYLVYHQHWEPSYIRQRMLPMLSIIYLREMASNPSKKLLYGQYEFDSIQRSKVRFGHQCYVIKWKKGASTISGVASVQSKGSNMLPQEEVVDVDECTDILDESNGPQIIVDGGACFLLTDENIELVSAAFPEQVHSFMQEKDLRESKRKRTSSLRSEGTSEKSESPNSKSIQLSITEFYRSAKTCDGQGEESSKSKTSLSHSKSKSARRRLLFS